VVIDTHRRYLAEEHDLDWLRQELGPLRAQIQTLLQKGARGRDQKTANFCSGLLAEYDALWTFCDVQDIQIPVSNNAAERALRHAVILRRVQGGTQSEQGSRWIERILSIAKRCASKTAPRLTISSTPPTPRTPGCRSPRHSPPDREAAGGGRFTRRPPERLPSVLPIQRNTIAVE